MSEMLAKVQTDMLASLKAGNKERKNVLSHLISRAKLIAKNDKNREVTDHDVIQAVKKMIKDANDTKDFAIKANRDVAKFNFEISVLSEYLPQQLSKDELNTIVTNLVNEGPEGKALRGFVMKNMNQNYKGSFNPQDVNQILVDMGI